MQKNDKFSALIFFNIINIQCLEKGTKRKYQQQIRFWTYCILFLHSISRYLKKWEGNVLCRTVDPDCSQLRKKWKISQLKMLQTNSWRKISIFKFPKDECMLQKWIKAIPREGDHWAASYNGVCELHFQKEDFFNPDSNMHRNSRQRSAITTNLSNNPFEVIKTLSVWRQLSQ